MTEIIIKETMYQRIQVGDLLVSKIDDDNKEWARSIILVTNIENDDDDLFGAVCLDGPPGFGVYKNDWDRIQFEMFHGHINLVQL
jgi:hypothetical protein